MAKTSQFDFIICGATIEGLLTGYYLHQKGFKTLVLEASDKVGGLFSSIETGSATISSLFTTPSCDENSLELFNWFKTCFDFQLEFIKRELPPVTFEKGHFEPFVGFGENAPKESEYLQDLVSAQRLEFTPSLTTWIKNILESGLEIRYNSNVTAMNMVDKEIANITINDKDTLEAENYIFTYNPLDLLDFFGPDSNHPTTVSQKTISRLSKGNFWSTLQLSVVHREPVTDRMETHVLYGTQKNPIVTIGRFSGTTSQWISFISSDVPDINEEGVQILKEMKRQIKRAYSEALNNLEFDKIALWPKTHGHIDLKNKHFGQLEGVNNICLCSNYLVEQANPFIGALFASKLTLELLDGFISKRIGSESEISLETPSNDALHNKTSLSM